MIEGLRVIREIHQRLVEKTEMWREMDTEAVRICWQVPPFMDPEEEGWVEGCWLSLKEPYLTQYEFFESHIIPIESTRVYKTVVAHYPDAKEILFDFR